MANTEPRHDKGCHHDSLALLASGTAGAWSVTLDEATDGPDAWFLQIEGPAIDLFCQVSDPGILDRLRMALDGLTPERRPLVLGQINRIPLRLRLDVQHEKIAYVTVGPASRSLVRFSIRGADLDALTAAVRQAALDLTGSDLDRPAGRDVRAS